MDCRQTDKNLFSYCDNQISPEKRVLVVEHLEKCPLCRNKLELTIMENAALTDMGRIPELTGDFTSVLMENIKHRNNLDVKEHGSKKGLLTRISWKRSLTIFASTAAIIILLLVLIPNFSLIKSGHNIADNDPRQISNEIKVNTVNEKYESESHTKNDTSKNMKREDTSIGNNDAVKKDYPVAGVTNTGPRSDRYLAIYSDNSRSKKETLAEDMAHSETGARKLSYLQPENIPANFQLANIISEIDDTLTFIYKDTITDQCLTITVKSAEAADFTLAEPAEISPPLKTSAQDMGSSEPDVNSKESSIEKDIKYINDDYTIIINSPLPLHELADIASSIEFREVK